MHTPEYYIFMGNGYRQIIAQTMRFYFEVSVTGYLLRFT